MTADKTASKQEKAAKTETTLRKPQVRILQCLVKANRPLERKVIAEKAPVDLAFCTEYLGSNDDAKRAKNDAKMFPSLITLGLVKFGKPTDEQLGTVYEITVKGRKVVEKLK